jgi:NAD(P)-dependent dehydrogenase (short-subunit alcohol dehydrogenase family)
MARHGASVAVLDREPRAAERTVSQIERAGGRAVVVLADAFNDEECARAVARAHGALGGLDTLVNNVAAWSPAELFDVDPEQFDELITANPVAAREPRRKMTALGTEGDCWDAAAAVLFLASDHARWISGQVLSVDGGGPPRPPYPGMSRTSTTAGARS